ncbi:peptide ABC transporter permease [Sulfolobales archaeon HS-7]|nr:peptide ABC transporter permease [Sulfolobales archaeon HS-7]
MNSQVYNYNKLEGYVLLFLVGIASIGLLAFIPIHVSAQGVTIVPPNSSVLVDVSQTAAPDALDPATGFYVQDGPLFTAVYQELVEFNGSNFLQLVPVIAQNYSTTNYENYTFYIRQGVHFSDGVQVNASTVWFSFYRMILMGQGPGVSNYITLLFNATQYGQTGYALPWGVANAIHNVTGLPTNTNATLAADVLASILSNFNANNATIQKIMEYPYQAVVVKSAYEVEISTLIPYRYFLYDIAAWWGAIQDPVFVDQHGGVQPNTPNSYINLHGMPGTGPYEIVSVAEGFSTIVLKAVPNYWGVSESVPAVAQPAHISIIEIEYGLSHTARVEEFDKNEAQISFVSVPYIGSIYTGYQYTVPLSGIFANFGSQPEVLYIAMNTEEYPTNITAFRLALVHAVNYSALLHIFSYNGTILASEFVGPISPQFPVYNQIVSMDHIQPYSYNVSLALTYLNEAGYEGHFYVTLPNGTTVGNSSATPLSTLAIYTLTPITPLVQEELEIIQQNLEQIGIPTSIKLVTASVTDGWSTPSGTPDLVDLGWVPDWPDPIFQQLDVQTNVLDGGLSGDLAWLNNSVVNQMDNQVPFITNATEQIEMAAKIYNITYHQAPYLWLPVPYTYYFVQPYVKNFQYNEFAGYYYNMMYYQPYTTTPPVTTTTTTPPVTTTTTTPPVTTTSTVPPVTTTTHPSSVSTLEIVAIVIVIIVIIAIAVVFLRRR